MPVCGERYKYLAVTTGGYSFNNLYGLIAEPYAYTQWRALAEKIIGLVNKFLAKLQAIEVTRNPKTPRFLELTVERTDLLTHFEDLPSAAYAALSGFHAEEAITEASTVVSEALCVLERAAEAIEYYGEEPPEIGGITPIPEDKPRLPDISAGELPWYIYAVGGAAVVAVIAGLFYRVRGPQGAR